MVDVGDKPATDRRAVARAVVRMSPGHRRGGRAPATRRRATSSGTARIAGIQAAKRTGELIPLCHPLGLDHVDVRAEVDAAAGTVTLDRARRASRARTGVEMEAMTAASVAALTVYDMVKGLERGVAIASVALVEKSGGRSGTGARRSPDRPPGLTRCAPRPDHLDLRRRAARPRTSPARCSPQLAEEAGADVVAMEVVPDDFALIEDRLHHYVDDGFAFIFTTGGTGLHARRRHARGDARGRSSATRPGIAEAMRAESLRHTPMGMLSRGVAGIAGRTLIVNFPGSPKAIGELFAVVAPVLRARRRDAASARVAAPPRPLSSTA